VRRLAGAPAVLAVAAAAAVAGCGGSGSDDRTPGPAPATPPRFAALLARIPSTEAQAIALDVVAARRDLGLAADAAPAPESGGNDGARRLRALVAATVPSYPLRDNGPFQHAIDWGRVTGLVRYDGPPEVVIVGTRDTWSRIRARFERVGYSMRGGLLVHPNPDGDVLEYVTGRDGLIVGAGGADAARAALRGRTAPNRRLVALLSSVPGASRAARSDGSGCVRGVGVGYSPGSATGQFAVDVADVPALPARLSEDRSAGPLAAYSLLHPVAAGGRVVVPFTRETSTDPSELAVSTRPSWLAYFRYRCRGS
jgi:hypothetical protein